MGSETAGRQDVAMDQGKKEISVQLAWYVWAMAVAWTMVVFLIDGASYMRLMRPLITEPSCLKCHEKQGYRLGGISVSIPMAPLRTAMTPYYTALVVGHAIIWLVGFGGIGVAAGRLRKQVRQRKEMEAALRESEERSRVLVEHAPFGLSISITSP
jgi:PAS domain-containing protein